MTTALLFIGGIAGASLTAYIVPFLGWRGTFILWSLPAIATAAVWIASSPSAPGGAMSFHFEWRLLVPSSRIWLAIGLFGTSTLAYYTAASWLPFSLEAQGSNYVALVLLLMNIAQIPATLAITAIKAPWATATSFYTVNGLFTVTGGVGLALASPHWAWALALIFGASQALIATGALALPVVLAQSREEAAYNTALVLGFGYLIGLVGPVLGGLLADTTGQPNASLWPVAAGTIGTMAVALLTMNRLAPRARTT